MREFRNSITALREGSPPHPFISRLSVLQSQSRCLREEKNVLFMSEVEPHILSPTLSLATFLSEPMWPSVVDVYLQIQTRRRN